MTADSDRTAGDQRSLRERAEARLEESTEELDGLSRQEIADMVHDLRTHQVELEMQNEELRKAQAELVEARDKYQDLYDLAPIGYVTTSQKGMVVVANLTLCEMLGVERRGLVAQPLSAFILAEDQDSYYRHRRLLSQPGSAGVCELRLQPANGDPVWVRIDSVMRHSSVGEGLLSSTVSDISQRRLAEEEIAASLQEKELLLREIHHRVKNNMQVIISLLRLHESTIGDARAIEAFRACETRILAMSLVHEKLYRSKELTAIHCGPFVEDLLRALGTSHGVGLAQLAAEVGDVSLGLDKAMPLGLVITELVSNAMIHAFPDGREKKVTVSLQPDGDRGAVLVVADCGVGLFDKGQSSGDGSIGLMLVRRLVEGQLGGTLEVGADRGTTFKVTFDFVE